MMSHNDSSVSNNTEAQNNQYHPSLEKSESNNNKENPLVTALKEESNFLPFYDTAKDIANTISDNTQVNVNIKSFDIGKVVDGGTSTRVYKVTGNIGGKDGIGFFSKGNEGFNEKGQRTGGHVVGLNIPITKVGDIKIDTKLVIKNPANKKKGGAKHIEKVIVSGKVSKEYLPERTSVKIKDTYVIGNEAEKGSRGNGGTTAHESLIEANYKNDGVKVEAFASRVKARKNAYYLDGKLIDKPKDSHVITAGIGASIERSSGDYSLKAEANYVVAKELGPEKKPKDKNKYFADYDRTAESFKVGASVTIKHPDNISDIKMGPTEISASYEEYNAGDAFNLTGNESGHITTVGVTQHQGEFYAGVSYSSGDGFNNKIDPARRKGVDPQNINNKTGLTVKFGYKKQF